jgi:hypothetical protein
VAVAPFDDETGAVVVVGDVEVEVDDVDVDDVDVEADAEAWPVVRLVDVVAELRLVAAVAVSAADDEARKAKAPVSANPAAPRRAVKVLTRRRPAASLGDGG